MKIMRINLVATKSLPLLVILGGPDSWWAARVSIPAPWD
jgi:hypothetical protein